MARKLIGRSIKLMAKYNWEEIENAYQMGVDVDTICKKYKVTKKTLQNRIYSKKLELKSGNLNEATAEFGQVLGKFSGIAQTDKILEEIVTEKLNTIVEDNELIGNNRKLSKAFQGLIGQGMKSGMYKTASDIKAGVSAIKDIESIANPTTKDTNIQINDNKVIEWV